MKGLKVSHCTKVWQKTWKGILFDSLGCGRQEGSGELIIDKSSLPWWAQKAFHTKCNGDQNIPLPAAPPVYDRPHPKAIFRWLFPVKRTLQLCSLDFGVYSDNGPCTSKIASLAATSRVIYLLRKQRNQCCVSHGNQVKHWQIAKYVCTLLKRVECNTSVT